MTTGGATHVNAEPRVTPPRQQPPSPHSQPPGGVQLPPLPPVPPLPPAVTDVLAQVQVPALPPVVQGTVAGKLPAVGS